MAKSTRSKVKRQWRAKKREDSVYAATEAARLHRLSQKLKTIAQTDADGDIGVEDAGAREKDIDPVQDEMEDDEQRMDGAEQDAMDLESEATSSKRVSTHGPRGSRREEWRKSKGLPALPKSRGMNRQGLPAAKRKSGRSHRRR